MSIQPAQPLLFDFLDDRPVVVEVNDAPLSSDAGLLPIRQLDQRLGFTRQLAAALHDPRDPDMCERLGLTYTFGLANAVLKDYTADLLTLRA